MFCSGMVSGFGSGADIAGPGRSASPSSDSGKEWLLCLLIIDHQTTALDPSVSQLRKCFLSLQHESRIQLPFARSLSNLGAHVRTLEAKECNGGNTLAGAILVELNVFIAWFARKDHLFLCWGVDVHQHPVIFALSVSLSTSLAPIFGESGAVGVRFEDESDPVGSEW